MHTMRLKVNDSVYEKFLWFLNKFSKDEVEIISESADFSKNQQYLNGELDEILSGKANFIEMNEAEERLENIIKNRENNI